MLVRVRVQGTKSRTTSGSQQDKPQVTRAICYITASAHIEASPSYRTMDAAPLICPGTGVPLVPLPSSSPLHSFPAFMLSLCTALESNPLSLQQHLNNLAASHAAPAMFSSVPEGKPEETDQIVASLLRLAGRLKRCGTSTTAAVAGAGTATAVALASVDQPAKSNGLADGLLSPKHVDGFKDAIANSNGNAHEQDDDDIDSSVEGSTVEEVRKTCEEQIRALKLLHAEELHRAQVSHDEQVRCALAASPQHRPQLTFGSKTFPRSIAIVTSAIARGECVYALA